MTDYIRQAQDKLNEAWVLVREAKLLMTGECKMDERAVTQVSNHAFDSIMNMKEVLRAHKFNRFAGRQS